MPSYFEAALPCSLPGVYTGIHLYLWWFCHKVQHLVVKAVANKVGVIGGGGRGCRGGAAGGGDLLDGHRLWQI